MFCSVLKAASLALGLLGAEKSLKNWATTEKPKIRETLHKSGPGLMFMGFW